MRTRFRASGLAAGLAGLAFFLSACTSAGASIVTDGEIARDPLAIASFTAETDGQATDDSDTCSAPDVLPDESALDCASDKCVALTFDDGPDPEHTPRILAALDRWNAHGTFFVQGQFAAKYPELIRAEIAGGHIVGSHSWDHPQLNVLSAGAVSGQLESTDNAIAAAVGFTKDTKGVPKGTVIYTPPPPEPEPEPEPESGEESPDGEQAPEEQAPSPEPAPVPEPDPMLRTQWMRPPYGAVNSTVYAQLGARGQTAVMWSVDTEDWKNRDPEISTANVMAGIKPGAIVLWHDIHPVAEQALDCLMSDLTKQGYRFVTVQKLLSDRITPGQPVFSRETLFG